MERSDLKLAVMLCAVAVVFVGAGRTNGMPPLAPGDIVPPPAPAVSPEIAELGSLDADGDRLADGVQAKLVAYEQAVAAGTAALDEAVTVEFIFSAQITQPQLDAFVKAGGTITHIYKSVSYGWEGALPLSRLRQVVQAAGPTLVGVVEPQPISYNLDIATRTGRVRPYLWDSGYDGDSTITIAIMDSGVDDTHSDLVSRMEYWHDYTPDGSASPESIIAHGTHVAGIALGTGSASGVNPTTIRWTDGGQLPSVSYFYPSIHEVPVAVTQFDWMTNMVWATGAAADVDHGQLYLDSAFNWYLIGSLDYGTSSPLSVTNLNNPNPYSSGAPRLYSSYASAYNVPAVGRNYSTANTMTADVSNFGVGDSYNLFRGVAPGCRWAGAKVFTNSGLGNTGYSNAALDDMVTQRVAHNIKVINMSFGLTPPGAEDPTARAKVNTAVSNGIVVCISMGNDGPTGEVSDSARAAKAITVGSTNDANQLTDYTSTWTDTPDSTEDYKPDLLAPGGSLTGHYSQIMAPDTNDTDADAVGFADQVSNDYTNFSGTSMASPFAAGCAALVIDAWQTAGHAWNFAGDSDALFVKMLLLAGATETNQTRESASNNPTLERASANPTTGTNKDTKEGYGVINPDASVDALTLPLDGGLVASLGSGWTDRRAAGRYLELSAGVQTSITLTGMTGGDYDLYIYSDTPDAKGNPVILASSTNAGTNVNESITFTPAASERGYVFVKRVSGSGSFTLTGPSCPPPEAPTSASSDRDNFCYSDSGDIQLSVTGGSGDTVRWFDDACGGNDIGTGNPLTIPSPTVTTTYFARWENTCGESACASVTVTVDTLDTDGDGVCDSSDACPDTPACADPVDASGCAIDSDGDAVVDGCDQCPATPACADPVDASGCSIDSDGDAVVDGCDQCPATPACADPVDADGCPIDTDGDGVVDGCDQCPATPACADPVDANGCAIDTDGDAVVDGCDL
jgi:hypothetical protein